MRINENELQSLRVNADLDLKISENLQESVGITQINENKFESLRVHENL